MPPDILDSDFRREEEDSKNETQAWWESLIEDGEKVLLQQHVFSNKWDDDGKKAIKKQGVDDVFSTVLGA